MVTKSDVWVFEPDCASCGRSVGNMSRDEFYEFVNGSGLCFDCDPDSAETTPSIFWHWAAGELITIGDSVFCVAANRKEIVEVGYSHAHERARARGLSSSTKVNTNEHNVMLFVDGVERKTCPLCRGLGYYPEFWENSVCGGCDGIGSIETAIILPTWVLGIGCENV